ncbi:hypothetical protein B0H14DRAFT_3510078 [Mycena olivaceomarginata]|nr:hypothetical protein B0H14DRAFT_3510078 [Mycena olivaceomarginata]
MSPLHDLFKRNHPLSDTDSQTPLLATSKRGIKHHVSSAQSSGGAPTDSTLTFHNGGTHVPKRRRPDFSKLGRFLLSIPDKPPLVPGTEVVKPLPAFAIGQASALYVPEGEKSWLELVLYSHAHPESKLAVYHNAAVINGEVRVALDAPANLGSIDVWIIISSDSAAEDFMLKLPFAAMKVNVWNRKKGDPRSTSSASEHPFLGKFPAGTFVFPFEFPALPEDTLVKHPDHTQRKNLARVPLPPSYYVRSANINPFGSWGVVNYVAGVNVTREGLGAIDDEFDTEFQYTPLYKPVAYTKSPFPCLPMREDWPFARETLGGWTLTPFGGRGRLGEELVEVEGILGIQNPAVYTAGQTLEFSLVLWSGNLRAREALGEPGAVEVGLYRADVFAANALDPRADTRGDRYTSKIAVGRAWRTVDGRPAGDVPGLETGAGHTAVHTAPGGDETSTSGESQDTDAVRAPSPTPSLEDLNAADEHHTDDHFVRLDGEVRIPACTCPSFRYTHMGREYFLNILIRHPHYEHISPSGAGLTAECPVWYVVGDRFAHAHPPSGGEHDLTALPVNGSIVPVGPDAVRAPVSIGAYTQEKRPTSKFPRILNY